MAKLTWFVGGRCVRAVLLMMELGMSTSSPAPLRMVVWRQVMSFTTPVDEPTSMLSPGLMMRSRLTCKPPMRFDSVSWKPSEMAMPPMPSAVMAALTSTRKQVDSMMHTPVIHTAPRAMLMKMELEGKSRSSLMASTRPRKRLVRRATTAVIARMTTAEMAVVTQSVRTIASM